MTAKDLNLLTDPKELAAWAQQNALAAPPPPEPQTKRPSRPRADLAAVPRQKTPPTPKPHKQAATADTLARQTRSIQTGVSTAASLSANKTGKKRQKQPRGGNGQWLLTGVIALANMLFLVLAGLWLTGTDLKGVFSGHADTPPYAAGAEPSAWLEANARLTQLSGEIEGLRAQVDSLQTMLIAQPAPVAPKPAEQPAATVSTAAAQPERQEPAPLLQAPEPILWQVNLGDYASRKAARVTQQKLQALGLQSTIEQNRENGQTTYLVTLAGFERRLEAENVANRIMLETELNGLWVARNQ